MKLIIGLLIFVTLGISVQAQDARVIAELSASSETIVKNSPFSADAVSESIQTLADGNRIVRNSTSKLYRNGEGRFRREFANGSGGMLGSFYSYGSGITILDPVAGQRYLLDPNQKTARQALLRQAPDLKSSGQSTTAEAQKAILVEKLKGETKTAAPVAIVTGRSGTAVSGTLMATGIGGGLAYSSSAQSKYETRNEQLGIQNIEGIEAEGTRTTTTIPAGAVGNERPIDIVYERWYSKDLQLVVMSKHNDPRSGEQIYRLTNIARSEPDPSLFSLPGGYRLITEAPTVYRIDTTRIEAEKAAAAKSAPAGVKSDKTKP